MKFSLAQYEQLFATYVEFLELLVESKSHVTAIAQVALQNFKSPNFKDDYWPQFSSQFKKLLATAGRYASMDGEDEVIQVKIRRMIPLLAPVEPLDFLSSYKDYYLKENSEEIAKSKLKAAIQECLDSIDPMYRYVEKQINEYDAQFDLVSVDKKRTIMVDVSLNAKDQLDVVVSGKYQDEDLTFDIDEIKFDMLQFQTLQNCIGHVAGRIALNVTMKINGTRFRVGNMPFVLTNRDLAKARADLMLTGKTLVYSQAGDTIQLNTSGNGKLVDRVAQRLLNQSNDKLHYVLVQGDVEKISKNLLD